MPVVDHALSKGLKCNPCRGEFDMATVAVKKRTLRVFFEALDDAAERGGANMAGTAGLAKV